MTSPTLAPLLRSVVAEWCRRSCSLIRGTPASAHAPTKVRVSCMGYMAAGQLGPARICRKRVDPGVAPLRSHVRPLPVGLQELHRLRADGDATDVTVLVPLTWLPPGTAATDLRISRLPCLKSTSSQRSPATSPRRQPVQAMMATRVPQSGSVASRYSITVRTSSEDGGSISLAPSGGSSMPSVAMIET